MWVRVDCSDKEKEDLQLWLGFGCGRLKKKQV
jgi:hypothetical protein